MEEKMMRFWINTCGRMQRVRDYYMAERCCLCGDGQQYFKVSDEGSWSCQACGESGDIWSLLCQLHTREIAKNVLKKFGLEKLVKAVEKDGKK